VGNLEFVVPFVGVVFAIVGAAAVKGSRRSKALRELGATRQWDLRKRDSDLPRTFAWHPFGEGHGRVASNVLTGRHNDHRVLVFDYRYRTPGSDGDDTHTYWLNCVDDLPAALPPLEVLRRTRLAKARNPRPGVEFRTGDPGFDARYLVRSASPQLAADVLGPDLVRLLMSWPDLSWRIEGNRLLAWGRGPVQPHWVEPTLNMLCSVADAIPAEVWRNAGGRGSA
jgi:hypothetical protein